MDCSQVFLISEIGTLIRNNKNFLKKKENFNNNILSSFLIVIFNYCKFLYHIVKGTYMCVELHL